MFGEFTTENEVFMGLIQNDGFFWDFFRDLPVLVNYINGHATGTD
jgi:hypothetical protein